MPVVDRVVVLDARVSAGPCRLGHLGEEFLGINSLDHAAIGACGQAELITVLDSAHEQIGDAHRVIGVLVLNGGDVLAAEIHVEAGILENADLLLFADLGLDELLDIRMIDVEHDHLRCATCCATALDGAGGCVSAAHEGDRAGGGAAGGLEELLAGADTREVQACTRATLEDEALFLVPVEDGIHRVVNRENEAGADLLRGGGADVEPHRRVEAEHLVQQHVGELVLEDLGIGVGTEVAVLLARLRVGEHHAVDELLETPLASLSADSATEVLGRDDGGGVHAPEVGELDTALLEDDIAGLPVGLDDVATLPVHAVIGMLSGSRVEPLHGETGLAQGVVHERSRSTGGN